MKKSLIIIFSLILFFSLVTFTQAQETYDFLRKWSTTKDTHQNPTDMTMDKHGYVYVAGDRKIVKYTRDGTYVFHIENIPNSEDFYFSSHEMNVAVDDSGNIYVSSREDNMIVKFNSQGDYVDKWDSWTEGTLQNFDQPAGIAVDDSGNIYVCDSGNYRIVKFDSSGNYIAPMWDTQGFNWAMDIAIFDSDNIYVVDRHNHRVQVFNSAGVQQREWGEYGTDDGKFKYPEGIGVDFEGNVYTADPSNNHRITKFQSDGTFITKWGSYGDDNYHFHDPRDVEVDYSGHVYIVDRNNWRIIVYKRTGAPTVEITNPVQDEFIKANLWIQADVTVPGGYTITDVEFYRDDTLLGTDFTAPYELSWEATGETNGPYTIWAVATNNEGAKTRERVSVIVADGDDAPTCSITNPSNLAEIRDAVTIRASATDDNAIDKVEFYVDDVIVGEDTDNTDSTYEYAWDTTTVNDGEKVLKVISYDAIGQFTSDTITVTVENQEEIGYIDKWYTDNPMGVALDSDGNLHVSGSGQIKKYAPDGTYISTIENTGSGDFNLTHHLYIAIDNSGNIYALSHDNHNVMKFDSDGNYVTKWGSFGDDDDQFYYPEGIACDSTGNVYIADSNNHRISKYSSDGSLITTWGTQGGGDGHFNNPQGIAIDASDNVFVADRHNSRVQVFTTNGTFQRKWSSGGINENYFDCPTSIAFDSLGNFYIADDCHNRVLKFDPDGTFITKWGTMGSGDLQFHCPRGIAVDSDFYVYVADRNNNRIVKFKSTWLPTVSMTNPTDNSIVSGTYIIQVTASSAIGIDKVEFYKGVTKLGEDTDNTDSTYEYSWDTTLETDGTYTLKAIAYNTQDTTQETAEISVVVNNTSNALPTVSLTNPVEGDIIRLAATLQAEASDIVGIDRVEFYVDDVKIGEDTDNTDNTYEYSWDATTVEDGARVIKVVAFDTIGQNAEESITVTVINHEEFGYMTKWSLDRMNDVVLDKDGNLYVASAHRISKYTPDGTLISRIENIGSDYDLTWWFTIAVDNVGNIYAANRDRHRITKFDSSGNYVTKWGSYGEGNYQFHSPTGIAVDSDGYVYVCDSNNNRISKFSSDGTFEKTWGSSGGNDGLFNYPQGIAIDASNNIYVTDGSNNRIQVFSSDGTFIRKWGQWGYEDHQLRNPSGIALDSEGNVYVVDGSNYKVVKFTSDGTFLAKWGEQGSGDLQFECPYGIAVDSDFYVYVADQCNNRVTKFNSTWRPTVAITNPADNSVLITSPVTIQATASSTIGISKVEFYINDVKVGEDTTNAYEYSWVTSSEPNGAYTLKAIAYNTQDTTTESGEIYVVVNKDGLDESPIVSITNPAEGDIIRLQATLQAAADDDEGVAKVEFYVDNTQVKEDTAYPFEYPSWDTTTVEDGQRVIKVVAFDTIGQNVEASITVTVINHEEFGYVTKWSHNNASDVAVDKDGYVYVAGSSKITKYTPDGTLVFKIEYTGNEEYYLDSYFHIAVDADGNIYASENNTHTIVKFDSNGNYLFTWGSYGHGDYQFYNQLGIAADSEGNVYICDYNNNRIVKYDSEGTLVTEWGTQGGSDGEFNNPHGIAVDSSDNIYVTDRHNNRIQVFDSDGEFLRRWGSHGYEDNQFRNPWGIAVDSEDSVYIVDGENYRVVKYTSNGTFLAKWGSRGSGDLQFECMNGIAVDSDFYVYVTDDCNHRITKFRSDWRPTVEITFPADNSVLAGPVTIQVTTNSAIGISKVELYKNGTLLGEATFNADNGYYEYGWDTSLEADGAYTIKAIAYNTQNTSLDSDEIYVVVNKDGLDAFPTVSLTNPAEGDIIRLATTIQAEASDEEGINRVEFYVDGIKIAEDTDNTDNTYEYPWDSTTVEDGERVIKVVAFDTIGQNAEASITVTVINHEQFGYVTKWNTNYPTDVEIDKDGNLIVADGHRISKYTLDGTLISRIENISSDYYLPSWMCIAVDDLGNIYITSQSNHQVIKFDSNGNYVAKWGTYGDDNNQFDNPYGIAVDSDGFVYICDHNNHRMVKYDSDGTYVDQWGTGGDNDGQFWHPHGVTVDSSNNIYVVDQHNHRIQVFASDGAFIRKWGQWGYEDHQLRYPSGIALDSEENVYVVDNSNKKVVKYTSEGTFLAKWGSQGSGDLQFDCMYGIAVDSDFYVYVPDHCHNRITKFKSTWRPTVAITNPDDNSVLTEPVTIQATATSDIGISKVEFYINGSKVGEDTTNLYEYDWDTSLEANGAFTLKAIAYNTQDTTSESDAIYVVVNKDGLDEPPTVSITSPVEGDIIRLQPTLQAEASDDDDIGRVEFYVDGTKIGEDNTSPFEYTWDSTTVEDGQRVIKVVAFDTIGQNVEASITVKVVNHEEFGYATEWHHPSASDVVVDKDGYVYVAGDNKITKYTPDGTFVFSIQYTGSEEFELAWYFHIAVDNSGNIYATNRDRHYIIKFDSNGNYITKWGTYGQGDYQFNRPYGIAADSEENVYICDYDNNRIVKYDSEGALVTEWGSQGGNDSQFNNPHGIAVDSSDNIYVTDRHNNRIQVFDSDGEFLRRWGDHGYADNQFRNPYGIAVDSEDNVYIVDGENYRVVKYTSTGTFLTKWGSRGNGDLQFECINGIAVDSDFYVYVTDYCNQRITKFKSDWRPTVEITNPADNSFLTEPVTIQATASSAIGIDKVEFYLNGTKIGEDTTDPFEYDWDTSSEANGAYTVKAIAYNNQNTPSEPDEIYVVVNNTTDALPTVSLTNPAEGDIIRLQATIQAEALDAEGIDRVEFYVDDVKIGEDTDNTDSTYQYTWDSTAVEDGERVIKIVAFDTIGQNVEESITVTITNHEELGYVDKWGHDHPTDVAVDKDGNIYIAGNQSVSKYTPDGNLLLRIEEPQDADYNLSGWMHVAVDNSGNIYTSNQHRHSVVKFDSNGNYVAHWGSYGGGNNQFDNPWGIAVDSAGNVHVVDHSNHRISKFNSDGTFLDHWGTNANLSNPMGIAIDSSDNIYVTDHNRVNAFNSVGELIRRWGNHGYADTQFRWPQGIAVDSEGNIYVADTGNYRIVKYTNEGTFVTKWGTQGSGDLQFDCPNSIAVDSDFNVYVTDNCNSRVTIVKSTWLPAVEITNPADNSVLTEAVTIQVTVSSAIGISKVEFYIDGTLVGEDTTNSYEYFWDTSSESEGTYTIKVIAYNIQNIATESDEISVVVNNSGNEAPTVDITSPQDGEIIRKWVDIEADAADDIGIDRVEFYIADTLVSTDTEAPYVHNWDTTTVGDGETEVKAVAFDGIGQNTTDSIFVAVANQEAYEYISKFHTWDWGHARGIALDKHGHIYATFCHRIAKFTSTGGFLFQIDNEGSDNNYQLTCDMRIAVDDNGNIYVSNGETHQIIKFDPHGSYLTKWGSQGTDDDQFNRPQGLDVGADGNVYVCDGENHRISKYDPDGGYITKFGSQGHGDAQFQYPQDIVLDDDNNMYIAEGWNNRIQVLSSDGTFIRRWGNHGYGDGEFRCPNGVALDSEGNVYVADSCNHRVQKFSADGTFITKWGSYGSGDTNFDWPCDLAVDSSGNVYVADQSNQRIVIFRIVGTPAVQITEPLDNSAVNGSVWITATAESEFGINRVEFYIDDVLEASRTESPYVYEWDSTTDANGSHEIKAVAYNSDLKTTETSISVVVNNGGDAAPTVSITNISDDSVIRGTVIVRAEALDAEGIETVEFYVDETLIDSVTVSPAASSYDYSYTWDTTAMADGQKELKIVAHDTLGQSTWATVTVFVDNSYSMFSADLSGAAVVFINTENKLRKIDLEGNISPVISLDSEVGQFQFGPAGNLYIFFWGHQPLKDQNSYILVKVNPETNEVIGIDKTLSHMEWNEHTASSNIQFDGQGNTYYLARDENWNLVLRKYTPEGDIEDLIHENMNIWHWHVRHDGTVVMGGETETTQMRWLRRLNPNDPDNLLANIAEPSEIGWVAEFPDNRIYAGMRFSDWHHGIYRLPGDLSHMPEEDEKTPYIGVSDQGYDPEYDVWQIIEGYSDEYCRGFYQWHGGAMLYCEEDAFGNVYGLMASWWETYRTVLRLYPSPEIIEPQTVLLDRPTLMRVWQDKIVIAGSKDGVNKLVLYNIATEEETNLLEENIEIYHLDVLSNGNIIFDGLRFSDNKIVVAMLEQAAGAPAGMAKPLGYGFKELAELGGRPLSFGVFKEVSGSTAVAVSIASLTSGSTVSGVVKIQAAASSPEGVSKVEFYIDGELKATDLTASYIYTWDTTAYAEGSHTIKVKMYDKASQTAVDEIPVIVNNETSPGEIVLSTNQIDFAASTTTSPTTGQKIVIENTGGMPLNWTAAPSQSWIQVSPTSGTGSGIITVAANPAGLSVGKHTENIVIKDPNATNSPQWVEVNLTIYSPVSLQEPFGAFETPQDGTSGIAGACPVTGWALDDIEVARVEIWREPVGGEPTAVNGLVYIGDAVFVEGARPDVAEMYQNYPLSYQAGWGYMLLTSYLPNSGNGTYTLYAVAYDKEGNKADLGSKTISCDNANASEPFGAIDTPTEGGEASGGTFINFGWALTPQPHSIQADGSTITVYVNGEDLGHPVYNQYRSDVANLFPGYANSDGAVGYFYLDTTVYMNGVHVIAWNVQDDGGNSADIGTKYFTIVNVDVMGSLSAGMRNYSVDSFTAPAFGYVDNLPTSFKPVRVRSGNRRNVEPAVTEVDNYGIATIAIREVERVQVELGEGADYEGYLIAGGGLRPLPAGSTLNTEKGTFSWQPGAGFVGNYDFVFIKKDAAGVKTKVRTRITILPKFSIY